MIQKKSVLKLCLFVLFFNIVFSQASITDLKSLNTDLKSLNNELDLYRSELMELDKESLTSGTKDEILDAEKMDIVAVSSSKSDLDLEDLYFGYNFFESEIDFFDNAPIPSNYLLGPGDEIIISLWGEMNVRERFVINKNGQVFYDGVGFISISNMSISKAEKILVSELGKIYSTLKESDQSTNLSLELGKLKSLNIFISGMVLKPGIHLIHPFSDIFTALIQSGGVDLNGSLRAIQIIRNNQIIANVDLYDFFNKGSMSSIDLKLIDGDVIYVPPVKKRVEIKGEVIRPGYYEVTENETPNDLIEFAAGRTSMAANFIILDKIIPIEERTSDDSSQISLNINFLDTNSVVLNNGDKVIIPKIYEDDKKVEVYGRVKVPGKYSSINSTVKDILDLAGGFDDPFFRKTIDLNKIIILRKDENQFYAKEIRTNYKDSSNIKLEFADKIFVYEDVNYNKSFTYRINGEIERPGTYGLVGDLTINDAINLSGGLTPTGSKNAIQVLRKFEGIDEEGESFSTIESVGNINFSSFLIKDGDEINILPKSNVINVEGNVYNPGLISIREKGISLAEAIELAGGYKPFSIKRQTYILRSNGEITKANIFGKRAQRVFPGDSVFVPLNPEPEKFDITSFIADLSTTLANLAAILVIIDRN